MPRINSYPLFCVSFVFLIGGFILESYAWSRLLYAKGYKITFTDAVTASGLSVFAKYVPGKIMIVVSRSAYLNKTLNLPLKEIGVLSLLSQLINLLVGGVVGLLCFHFWNFDVSIILGFVLCLILLLLVCFSSVLSSGLSYLLRRFLKGSFVIPKISFNEFLPISPWFVFFWLSYSFGFWFLVNSTSSGIFSLNDSLFYPSSMVAGVLAFFAPGGIGVREGALAYFFNSLNWSQLDILTLSVSTRFWFLIGEVVFFLTALTIHFSSKK